MNSIKKKYAKEEKRNQNDQKKIAKKPINMEEYRRKFLPSGFNAVQNAAKISSTQAKKLYSGGSTVVYTSPTGKKSTYGKYLNNGSGAKKLYSTRYSNLKPEEMNLVQLTAYMRGENVSAEEWQYLANEIQNPSSVFYNPYWKGRSTQTAAMDFFRDYFGTDDIRFDQQFFDDNIALRQYAKRNDLTGNLIQPSSRDSQEVWAAYFYESLLADKQYSDNAVQQWNQLRSDASTYFNNYKFIHGRTPTMDEFLENINIEKYPVLHSMDASRNVGSDKSSKVVQLNTGCNYSREGLYGLYAVLENGGNISEDRDYFEDAVQYWMQPYEDAAIQKNTLAALGFDNSGWTDEDYVAAMQEARKTGDSEVFEALKQFRWQNAEHMDSVDTTDYLGARFGYRKDEQYFASIRSVYQPIWNEMYTDSSRSSIKKPSSSDPEVYHAAYQAWQECQGEADLKKVEAQARDFLKVIDEVDIGRWDNIDDYRAYIDAEVLPMLQEEPFAELSRYMKGDLKLVRDVFISEEEIDDYIQAHWGGKKEEPVAHQEPDTVIMQPDDKPVFYDYEKNRAASESAAQRNADAQRVGQALISLSESGANVAPSQLALDSIPIIWGDSIDDPVTRNVLSNLWLSIQQGNYDKKIGPDATDEQIQAIDPVAKMLATEAKSDDTPCFTLPNIRKLIEQQTISQMAGSELTVADGVIAATIPDADVFYESAHRFEDEFKNTNPDILKEEFDFKTYTEVYDRGKESGYAPEDAADIAINASVFVNAGIQDIATGLEDNDEVYAAAKNIALDVVAEEGFVDAVAVVAPILGELVTEDKDAYIFQATKELAGYLMLGMSQKAPASFAAVTKDFLHEVMRGDITAKDILSGIKNTAYGLKMYAAKGVKAVLPAFAREANALGFNSPVLGTEKYDALDEEAKAKADSRYNQKIIGEANGFEIMNSIINFAKKNGHDDIFETGKNKAIDTFGENLVVTTDVIPWAGTVTGLASEETQEQYKVYRDLDTYGKWFSYDEGTALYNAWKSGYITYNDFSNIVMDRVSEYSSAYVNGLNNPGGIANSIQIARDFISEKAGAIYKNLVIEGEMPDEKTIAEANSVLSAVEHMADPIMLVENNEILREAIGYDALLEKYGDNEMALFDAIYAELNSIVTGTEMHDVHDNISGGDYSLPQLRAMEKLLDVYEEFGAYGYDLIYCGDDYLYRLLGINPSLFGGKDKLELYMDEMTDGAWRTPYSNPGMGFVSTLNNGMLGGFQGVGNLFAEFTRFSRDVLDFLPGVTEYEEGDGSYYDRVQSISGKRDEWVEVQGTGFEKFASLVVSEATRNQLTGILGAFLGGKADAKTFAKHTTRALTSIADRNIVNMPNLLQLTDNAGKAIRTIDASTVIARGPFGASVAIRSYSRNRDRGKNVLNSIMRASIDTAIELFTETVAVDSKLNAVRNRIFPWMKKTSSGVTNFIYNLSRSAFNEIGQEEIALVLNRAFDVLDGFNTDAVTDASSFFKEMWKSIKTNTKGMGEEAVETAASTFFIVLLGSAYNIPGSLTNRNVNERRITNGRITSELFADICEDAAFDIGKEFSRADNASEGISNEKTDIKDEKNGNRGAPIFDRTRGAVYTKAWDVFHGRGNSEDLEQSIAKELDTDDESVVVDEEPEVDEISRDEYDPSMEMDWEPTYEEMTPGAKKTRIYIEEAEEGRAEAVAEEVMNMTAEQLLAEDVGVINAEKATQAAKDALNKARAALDEVRMNIINNNLRLRAIYAAAAAEQRDFNSPDILNATASNQQATGALRNDAAAQEKVVKEAEEAVSKAESEQQEIAQKAQEEAEDQARKAEEQAKLFFKKAKETLRAEALKQIVAPKSIHDDIETKREEFKEKREEFKEKREEFKEKRLDTTRTKSDAPGKELWDERIDTPEEEQYLNYNTMDDEGDNTPLPESSETAGADRAFYPSEFGPGAENLPDLFNELADVAERNAMLYQVNVPKKLYSKLFGILSRMPNGDRYTDIFFRHSKNTDQNADGRPTKKSVDKTVDRARRLSKTRYDILVNNYGIVPLYETDDEIIVKIVGEQKGLASPEVVKAEEEFKTAARKFYDLKAMFASAKAFRNKAAGKEKQELIAAVHDYASQMDEAEQQMAIAEDKLRQAKRDAFGFAGEKYVALRRSEVEYYIGMMSDQKIIGDIDAGVQKDKLIEQYKAGKYSSEHLHEVLIENTDFSGMDEETAGIVRSNIAGMSDAAVIEELETIWAEAERAGRTEGLLGMVPYMPFESYSDMAAYVRANGGRKSSGGVYENVETEESYYVNAALLAIVNRFNAAQKEKKDDFVGPYKYSSDKTGEESSAAVPVERTNFEPGKSSDAITDAIVNLGDLDLEEAMNKIVDMANQSENPQTREGLLKRILGTTENHIDDGTRELVVDISPSGTLRINTRCQNRGLKDAAGNFIMENAEMHVRKALFLYADGYDNDYTVHVAEMVNGKRVVRQVGAYYKDLGAEYCPTYAQLVKAGAEVYIKHTDVSQSGKTYKDLEFSVALTESKGKDTLQTNLDEASKRFNALAAKGVNGSEAWEQDRYTDAYIRAKAEKLEREIFEIARGFRLNGDRYGADHTIQLADELRQKKAELDELKRYIDNPDYVQDYFYMHTPQSAANGKSVEEIMAEMDANGEEYSLDDLSEMNTETAPELEAEDPGAYDSEGADHRAEIGRAIDQALTEGMTPAERADYYAERANDALMNDDAQRFEQYNREVQKAAAEAGVADTSEIATTAQENEAASEDKETVARESENEKNAATPTETSAESISEERNHDALENDPMQQAFDEYEVSSENEEAIDAAYPGRNDLVVVEEEPSIDDEPVDENTIVKEEGTSRAAILRGRAILQKQNSLIRHMNRGIDELSEIMENEWEDGARRFKERYDERMQLQAKRDGMNVNDPDYHSVNSRINRLYTEQMRDTEGLESYRRWKRASDKKNDLVRRRNIAKHNLKQNSQLVNGTDQAKQIAEDDVRYNPFTPIAGSKGNRSGAEIAKSILNKITGKKKLKYGRITALPVERVADLISEELDKTFFDIARKDAEIISKTRRSTQIDQANDIYKLAVIDEILGEGKSEDAKDALIAAYKDNVRRNDFSEGGYYAYRDEVNSAKEKAIQKAAEIKKEFEGQKPDHALHELRTRLSFAIANRETVIANMMSAEKGLYHLGNGDIAACLRGDFGGQIPAPLMNIFTGMVYNAAQNAKGKKGRSIARAFNDLFDNAKRNVVSELGDYAPLINSVFIIPAQRANDALRAERTRLMNELSEKIPDKKFEVTANKNGEVVTQEMKLSEIVAHIIDERTNEEYAKIPENEYVSERLDMYGINDEEARKEIIDAVDYARTFNENLYIRTNSALAMNGHYSQNYDHRQWYMHHYNPELDNSFLSRFGIYTGEDEINQVFADDTGARRPSHQFNASALQRHGNTTGYDFIESVRRTINPILNTIYQTGHIDRLKQFEQAVNGSPKLDERGNPVLENGKTVVDSEPLYEVDSDGEVVNKNHIVAFGNAMGRFAQRAANKRTGQIDRVIMQTEFGRKAMGWLKLAVSLRSASAVGFNPMSALTNFAPIKFLVGICTPGEITSALASTVAQMSGKAKKADFIKENSNFVKGRTAYSEEERSVQGKLFDAAYAMNSWADSFTTNFMARALFNHEIKTNRGDVNAALVQTEDMLRAMLTDKSRTGRSQFYENMSLGGFFGQFQQEAVNEMMYMLKDMKYYGGKMPKTLAMLLGVFVLNALFNYVRGSDSMPDLLGEMVKAHNYEEEDATPIEKVAGYGKAALKTLNPIDFFETGETAVTTSANDVVQSVSDLITGEDDIWNFFVTVGSVVLPGGTTLKRGYTGIKSVAQGYAKTADGKAKFVIDDATPGKYLAAAVAGVNALPEAKPYIYGFDKAMEKGQTLTFEELVSAGMDRSLAWQATKGTKAAKSDTTDAENIATIAGATEEEIAAADTQARQSREEAGVPSDISSWGAAAFSEEGSNAVKTGVQAWIEYGVDTYPKEITTETFNLDDTSYIRQDGVARPLDEQDYAAINELYRQKYEAAVRTYGRITNLEAAKELEKALNKARTEARNEYMQNGYFERERGEE